MALPPFLVRLRRSFYSYIHGVFYRPCSSEPILLFAEIIMSSSDRPVSLDDLDGEDDGRAEFACPFCDEEFDIGSLCSHLDEEHCFEPIAAVCPVCAARVGQDMVGHIALQHGQILKMQRRRRLRKPSSSSNSILSLLGKELGEDSWQARLNGDTYRSAKNSSQTGTDPLLSCLLYSLPIPETLDVSKSIAAGEEANPTSSSSIDDRITSLHTAVVAEDSKQKLEEATLRAKFVEQLVLSTIFSDY